MNKLMIAMLASVAVFCTASANAAVDAKAAEDTAKKFKCAKCHLPDKKKTGGGPSIKEIAKKNKGDKDALGKLVAKVKKGGDDHPDTEADEADIKRVVEWFLSQ